MKAASFSSLRVALAISNTVALLAVWQVVTSDSPSSTMIGAFDIPAVRATESHPSFKRVQRQTDSSAVRLFSLVSETVRAAELVEQNVPQVEPAMRLVGIIVISEAAEELIALVEYGSPARVHRLRDRDIIPASGWRVEKITQASAYLVKRSEKLILNLDSIP